MSVVSTHQLKFEMWALRRSLNPMVNGGNSRFAKVAYLAFVVVWGLLVLDVTTADPPMWLLLSLTALLGIILGKMWDVEVQYWLGRFDRVVIRIGNDDE
jgi:hypothetical protein